MARRRMTAHRNAGANLSQYYILQVDLERKAGPFDIEKIAEFIIDHEKRGDLDEYKFAADYFASNKKDVALNKFVDYKSIKPLKNAVDALKDEGDLKIFYAKVGEKKKEKLTLAQLVRYIARVQPLHGAKTIEVAFSENDQAPADGDYKSWRKYPDLSRMVAAAKKSDPYGFTKDVSAAGMFTRGLIKIKEEKEQEHVELNEKLDRLEKRLQKDRFSVGASRAISHGLDLLDDMIVAVSEKPNARQLSNMAFQWGQAIEDMANQGVNTSALRAMQRLAKEVVKEIVKEGNEFNYDSN